MNLAKMIARMIQIAVVYFLSVLSSVRGNGGESSTIAPGVIITQGLINEAFFPEAAPKGKSGYNWLSIQDDFGRHRFNCMLQKSCSLVEAADKTRTKCAVFSTENLERVKTISVMCNGIFGAREIMTVTRTDVKELSTLCLPRKGMIKNYGAVRMGPIKASLAECAEEMYRISDSSVGVTWVMTEESAKFQNTHPNRVTGQCLFFYPKLHQNLDLLTGEIENTYSCVLRCNRAFRRMLAKAAGMTEVNSVSDCIKIVSAMNAYSAVSFKPGNLGGIECSYGKEFNFFFDENETLGLGGCPLPKPSKRVELMTKIIIDASLKQLTQEEMIKFKLSAPTSKPEVPDTDQSVTTLVTVETIEPKNSAGTNTESQDLMYISLSSKDNEASLAEDEKKTGEGKKGKQFDNKTSMAIGIGGALAGVFVLGVGGYCCVKKRKKSQEDFDPYDDEYDLTY